MTGKDFLKLLLCIYEYDSNIEIETERSFGDLTYDVTAVNRRTLDVYHGVDYGLYNAVYSIIDYMAAFKEYYKHAIELEPEGSELAEKSEDDGHSFPPELSPKPSHKWAMFPIKEILDDDFREKTRKKWIAEKWYMDKYNEFFRELEDRLQDSMPCRPHEKCKDRVYRDDVINDNCELHYSMKCPKLKEWGDSVTTLRREKNKEWYKYCEDNGIANPFKKEKPVIN